ncbi:MAG TPA: PadR family transcriptional regulator [Actinomycetota bacterium]|jgi:DNA-binding PadR family transcriptional regulator|nr:PadR family transcriptional regulator [Actinomycetota bacterium]
MSNLREINATAASLLGFLHAGPMTGWELDAAVGNTIIHFWNVTRSQVYRELRTLAQLGYVEAGDTGPRDRRPYAITDAGREAFAAWIVRHPGQMIVRMPLLLTVFFGKHLPPGRLEEIIEIELREGVKALKEYEAMLESIGDSDPFMAQILRFGVEYQKTLLRWIEGLRRDPSLRTQQVPSSAALERRASKPA